MPACIFPNCPNPGNHNFSVRLRRPDTTAIWAPNTQAYVCDDHAAQGVRITVVLEPTQTANVETHIVATDGSIVDRTTPIVRTP